MDLPVSTRRIGLSLGADLCWPACYEHILRELRLDLPLDRERVRFEVERVTVEPYDLKQPVRYDVVLDRLTHWFPPTREWLKKAVLMDGVYTLNNPWSIQSAEKHTTYAAMMHLGMPIPETWLLPPKVPEGHADMEIMLQRYGRLFDLAPIGERLGYPVFMKPYDGGGWVGVSRADDERSLWKAYDASGSRCMHMQAGVDYDIFIRCIGVGPQVNIVRYDPEQPLHDRYRVDFHVVDAEEWSLLRDITLTINGFFGWDFNSCETLRERRPAGQEKDPLRWRPIDFANACPDSQVTSLHFHFPWLVKALLRWSIFAAAVRKPMRMNMEWAPYLEVARRDLPYRERLAAYAGITLQRMEADRFVEFCDEHLAHLDEVVWAFFGTDTAKQIVRAKVAALFPAHEVEAFTEHFWGMIQFWRKTERDRLGAP